MRDQLEQVAARIESAALAAGSEGRVIGATCCHEERIIEVEYNPPLGAKVHKLRTAFAGIFNANVYTFRRNGYIVISITPKTHDNRQVHLHAPSQRARRISRQP